MAKLTFEGPRNRHTDYTAALVDSKGNLVGVGTDGEFSAEDADVLSAHYVLTGSGGKEREPKDEDPAAAAGLFPPGPPEPDEQ